MLFRPDSLDEFAAKQAPALQSLFAAVREMAAATREPWERRGCQTWKTTVLRLRVSRLALSWLFTPSFHRAVLGARYTPCSLYIYTTQRRRKGYEYVRTSYGSTGTLRRLSVEASRERDADRDHESA